ncbi:MAG: hypothetical protein QUV05_18445 [Phycisphaerae bacterium]|nr:hypothetical protein [Phycisphaerae bacterium]
MSGRVLLWVPGDHSPGDGADLDSFISDDFDEPCEPVGTGGKSFPRGLEPLTFSSGGCKDQVQETSQATPEQQLTSVENSGDSTAYPTAYPPNAEKAHDKLDDDRLASLVAEVAKLSVEARARLAVILAGQGDKP